MSSELVSTTRNSGSNLTLMDRPLSTQHAKLASPSVMNDTLLWSSGVSVIKPPCTAALRMSICCAPSHAFGWDRMYSTCPEDNKVGWCSPTYVFADWSMYLRKSANRSTAVFPGGSGGMSSETVAVVWVFGLRWSLNLIIESKYYVYFRVKPRYLPFSFNPLWFFC